MPLYIQSFVTSIDSEQGGGGTASGGLCGRHGVHRGGGPQHRRGRFVAAALVRGESAAAGVGGGADPPLAPLPPHPRPPPSRRQQPAGSPSRTTGAGGRALAGSCILARSSLYVQSSQWHMRHSNDLASVFTIMKVVTVRRTT